MSLDDVAKAMYNYRVRRIPWEELSEVGWKAEYRKMAEAAVGAYTDAVDNDPICPRCVFDKAVLDLADAGEFILVNGAASGDGLSHEERRLLRWARRWAANDAIQRCLEDEH
jgi:hypothetical protein